MLGFFNHAPAASTRVAGGDGRRLPDEAGVHAAVGSAGSSTRRSVRTGPRLSADRGRQRPADPRPGPQRLRRHRTGNRSFARRSRSAAYDVVDPELAGQRDDRARLGRGARLESSARSNGGSRAPRARKTVADPTRVYMAAKFEPGKIYRSGLHRAEPAARRAGRRHPCRCSRSRIRSCSPSTISSGSTRHRPVSCRSRSAACGTSVSACSRPCGRLPRQPFRSSSIALSLRNGSRGSRSAP